MFMPCLLTGLGNVSTLSNQVHSVQLSTKGFYLEVGFILFFKANLIIMVPCVVALF